MKRNKPNNKRKRSSPKQRGKNKLKPQRSAENKSWSSAQLIGTRKPIIKQSWYVEEEK